MIWIMIVLLWLLPLALLMTRASRKRHEEHMRLLQDLKNPQTLEEKYRHSRGF